MISIIRMSLLFACLLLPGSLLAQDARDVVIPDFPYSAAESLNTLLDRPKTDVKLPSGKFSVMPFGPAISGQDMGVSNIRGHGRNTMFIAGEDSDGRVFVCHNQGDHHDATIEKLSFFGCDKSVPIVTLSGYSMAYRDLFSRSQEGTVRGAGTGIKITGGQHYVLDNLQAEFCDVGIHLDRVGSLNATGLNGEFCGVGLLLTGQRLPQGIQIDGFYAESCDVGIRSEGVTFSLTRGVYGTKDRHVNHAVELIRCKDCFIDQSQGTGIVYLDEGCTGNMVILPTDDKARVVDKGQGNVYRTVAEPVVVQRPTTQLHRKLMDHDRLTNWAIKETFLPNESAEFEVIYSNDRGATHLIQVYDYRNREWYDIATNSWAKRFWKTELEEYRESPTPIFLPWKNRQACRAVVRVDNPDDVNREFEFRFLTTRAKGSTVTLYSIKKL